MRDRRQDLAEFMQNVSALLPIPSCFQWVTILLARHYSAKFAPSRSRRCYLVDCLDLPIWVALRAKIGHFHQDLPDDSQ